MITGTCLCKTVSLEIDEPLEKVAEACHCTQCRKQTGNFFVGINVRRTSLRIEGQEHLTWYQSSEQVLRGFCSICGSVLFWKPTIAGYEWTGVSLGCLDTSMSLTISKHTFVANKGSYYEISDDAPQHEAY